jgi:hypothetical protein
MVVKFGFVFDKKSMYGEVVVEVTYQREREKE